MNTDTGLPTPPLNASTPVPPPVLTGDASYSLDSIFHLITTSNNLQTLHNTLRSGAPRDVRDTILASVLQSGQDPLMLLDARTNTLGYLYILCAS